MASKVVLYSTPVFFKKTGFHKNPLDQEVVADFRAAESARVVVASVFIESYLIFILP
jgi:hypothetical protein